MNEAGGPKRYVAHPREQVAATRPGMDSDGPSRDTVADADSSVSPTGSAGEPLEMGPIERPAELQRAGINSVVRLKGAVVELRVRVRGASLHCLVDSGSTGNYISDRCLAALNIPVVPKDEHENLTLVDGSVVQAQGYAQFVLRCRDFK